ncbi:hypothetical protein [Streptomyces olivaceiscleroticus]|uniref:Uncharacterized protein n=1 Tax=Streptomyces olivaceiscleroticus TaxID=68245 RepID=A0ABP3KJN9_9ACTN
MISVDLSPWNSGDYEPDAYRAFFTVEPHVVEQLTENVLMRIQDGMRAVTPRRAAICIGTNRICPVFPAPSADWRKQLRSANGPNWL